MSWFNLEKLMRNCYCRFSLHARASSTAIYTSCQFHILVAVGCAHGMTIVMVAEKTARQTTRPTLWPHMQRNQIDLSSLSLDYSQKMPRVYWWFHYAGHVYVYYWYTWLMDTSTRPAARGVVRHSDPQKYQSIQSAAHRFVIEIVQITKFGEWEF